MERGRHVRQLELCNRLLHMAATTASQCEYEAAAQIKNEVHVEGFSLRFLERQESGDHTQVHPMSVLQVLSQMDRDAKQVGGLWQAKLQEQEEGFNQQKADAIKKMVSQCQAVRLRNDVGTLKHLRAVLEAVLHGAQQLNV